MAFNAHINITGSSSGAQQAVNGMSNSFRNAGSNMASFVKGLTNLSHVNNQVRANVNSANNALKDFSDALRGLAVAKIGQEIYKTRSQFVGWENQLYVTTGSIEKANEELTALIGVVKELGTDLSTSVSGFTQLNVAAQGSGLSSEELLGIFESFSGALMLFNSDTLKVEGTFRALTQMFSKGVIQAEELRGQLAEHLPGALQIAARALNTTTWDLGDRMSKGMLDPADVVPKMAAQIQKELGLAIERAMGTARGAYNRLITEVKLLMNQIGAMLEGDFINAVNSIASGISLITQTFKDNSKEIMLAVHLLGGYALAWGAVATAVSIFNAALALATVRAWLFNAAVGANPIVKVLSLAVTAVGLLAGAIYDARNEIVTFNGVSASVGSWTKAAYKEAEVYFSYVKHQFNMIAELDWSGIFGEETKLKMPDFSDFGQLTSDILNSDMMDLIVDAVNKLITGLKLWFDIWVQIGQFIGTDLGNIIQKLQNLIEETFNLVVGYVKAIGNAFRGLLDDIVVFFTTGDFSFRNMENAFNASIATIKTSFNGALDDLKNAWNNAAGNFEIKVDWDYDWIDGWSAKIETRVKQTLQNVSESANAIEEEMLDALLRSADIIAFRFAEIGLTDDQIKGFSKAYEELQTKVSESTDDAQNKTKEFREELRLLRTLGFEETQRAMISYRANMEYLANAMALLAPTRVPGVNITEAMQNEINDGLRILEENRLAIIEMGQAELELNAARSESKDALKDEEKSLKDTTKAVLEARNKFLDLLTTIADLDMQLRDHAYMYDELVASALGYADAIEQIRADGDNFVRTSLDIPVNITNVNDIHNQLEEMMTDLRAMDPVDIPIEFKTDGVLDADKVLADIQRTVETAGIRTDVFSSSLDELQSSATSASIAINALGISFTSLAKSQNISKTNMEQVAKSRNELQAAYNNVIQVEQQLGGVTNLSIEQQELYSRAVEDVTRAFDKYNASRQRQYEGDLLAISEGKQVGFTYERTSKELLALAESYDTAWARAERYKISLAEINDLQRLGKMTEFEASIKKAEATVESLHPLARSIGDAFSEAFKSIIDGSASAEEAFANMLRGIADAVYEELVAKQIVSIIGSLFNFGGFGGASGGSFTTGTGFNWAKGGIMSEAGPVAIKSYANGGIAGPANFKSYANGGIAGDINAIAFLRAANDDINFKAHASGGVTSKPMISLFGEGSMPEAYVPLPDGRSIPVTMKADTANVTSTIDKAKPEIKVVVNNLPGQNAEVSRDNQGGLTIDIVRASLATDVNKGGVPWVGAMERRYGMSRGHAR